MCRIGELISKMTFNDLASHKAISNNFIQISIDFHGLLGIITDGVHRLGYRDSRVVRYPALASAGWISERVREHSYDLPSHENEFHRHSIEIISDNFSLKIVSILMAC